MPFIISRVNVSVDKIQESLIKSELGKAIELIPGKSEEYLMIIFENDSHIWLRGVNNQPCAYIEVKIFGNEDHCGYRAMTQQITRIYGEVLDIPPENMYVNYEDVHTWGVRGFTFDENCGRV